MADLRPATNKVVTGAKRNREGIEFDVDEFKTAMECSDDHMVMGIDEAGRGPVLGPMVYTGAIIALREHDRLIDHCGVNDSKVLTEAHRNAALLKLRELDTFRSFTVAVTPGEIAAAMTGTHGTNLNTLSHDTAIALVRDATLEAAGRLCAAFVDTVGPPESYQRRLAARFPHLRVTVAKRAESKFPIVAAASIVAKVERDAQIARIGRDIGSGYPSDPKTMAWVRSHLHRFFVVPRCYNFVRESWGPVVLLAKNPDVCVPLVFEADVKKQAEKSSSGTGTTKGGKKQLLLSFAKPPPRRHTVYAHLLALKTIAAIEDTQHSLLC